MIISHAFLRIKALISGYCLQLVQPFLFRCARLCQERFHAVPDLLYRACNFITASLYNILITVNPTHAAFAETQKLLQWCISILQWHFGKDLYRQDNEPA
ncbi:MAG TPA: hypothetical protein VJ603_06895 [Paucimonas sp.]|nr:hypothetical protein [Paucimonas sp.]HJW54453.1 hypothetical protein [Burkholderiaceae bacterium]